MTQNQLQIDSQPESRPNSEKRLKSWRIFATGASFTIFGAGGLALSIILSILYFILPKGKAVGVTRSSISRCFQIYIAILKNLGLLTYEVTGQENLIGDSKIIIANHPSLIDVVFLVSLVRNANCVVKERLWHTPFTFAPLTAANYIKSNTENLIEESHTTLNSGASLVIFPEGTRTTPGIPPKFQRGAANIAIATDKDIIPVRINCTPTTLTKGEKWFQVPDVKPHFTIQILSPIKPKEIVTPNTMQCKAARELTRHLQQLLTAEDLTVSPL